MDFTVPILITFIFPRDPYNTVLKKKVSQELEKLLVDKN